MLDFMYLEKLINIKLKEVEDLENEENRTSEIEEQIDELNKQISAMRVSWARYEIAKLLGLDNDPFYKSHNYMGIELEDTSSLNQEQLTVYNDLISRIPEHQLESYKLRQGMAKILNKDQDEELIKHNYVDINKEIFNSTRYGLDEEEINKFNRLLDQYNNLNYEEVDYNYLEIAKDTLNDAFTKLNIEDRDEYSRIEERYLDVMDKLMDIHKGQDEDGNITYNGNSVLFDSINNKELFDKIRDKYPELKVDVTESVLNNLILNIVDDNLTEEKLNDYTDFVCIKLNEFSNDQEKQDYVNETINKLDRTIEEFVRRNIHDERFERALILRTEFATKIQNVGDRKLDIEDNQIGIYFRYIDRNYNNLSEEKRNKLSNYMDSGIRRNMSDPRKVDLVNNLLEEMRSSDYERELQHKYKNNYLKYEHRNYTTYEMLLQDHIKILERKKSEISKKDYKFEYKDINKEAKLKELDKEINELKEILVNYQNNKRINRTNNKYNDKTDAIIDKATEIEELKELKQQVNSKFRKIRIDKKIGKRQEKINKLKKSQVKIDNKQKRIMRSKLQLAQDENQQRRKYESFSEEYDIRTNDYRTMKEYEQNNDGLFSGIKETFYEFKEDRYNNKKERYDKALNTLNNGVVTNNGSNRLNLNNNLINNIRGQNAPQMAI